ncbi:TonB family protein [Paracoccus fistulariae]|uniref:TonB family protein n=1 Tax=Paracoccus fistulariae TaxID=658446 RepID=A0ABY7SPG3_9RHOB|nr:TonB family protein [Paracoccus fistulariae]MDB6182777.1 TonB family protein [Paracoccus fistulariae]WCR08878.1 TonB family protein [Paracoccus fistulariae]
MFKRFSALALAAALVATAPSYASAQTSFGANRKMAAAQNESQWVANTQQQIQKRLRNLDSTLNSVGISRNMTAAFAIIVERSGKVIDARIIESSGTPAVDTAIIRALSRLEQVEPFTPDMEQSVLVVPMGMGVGTK